MTSAMSSGVVYRMCHLSQAHTMCEALNDRIKQTKKRLVQFVHMHMHSHLVALFPWGRMA